jgi:hypothetical protein
MIYMHLILIMLSLREISPFISLTALFMVSHKFCHCLHFNKITTAYGSQVLLVSLYCPLRGYRLVPLPDKYQDMFINTTVTEITFTNR